MKSSRIIFCNNFQRLIAARGWKQEYIAEFVGVERSAVAKWIKGDALPGAANLDSLTRLFNVPLYAFFTTDEPNKPSMRESLEVICGELGFEAPKPLKKKHLPAQVGPDLSHVPETIIQKLSNFHGRWDLLETSIKALSEMAPAISDKDKKSNNN